MRWTKDNTNQCGPNHETYILGYCADICMKGDSLDENGFVVDNGYVHEYFLKTYQEVEVFRSCELIAIKTCQDFRKLLGQKLCAIRVTISGFPGAKLTAEWNRP